MEERKSVLLFPIVKNHVEPKKEEKVIFIDKNLPKIVVSVSYAFPMLIPEYGAVVSLDVTTRNYAEKIYNEIKDGIYSCSVHNYRDRENRMVSWNTFKTVPVDEKLKNILYQNIMNELKITPSFPISQEIISPSRWFCMYIKCDNNDYKNYFNYNVGIVYLKRDWLKNKKRIRAYVQSSLSLFEINSKFIILKPDGHVNAKDIKLHFLESSDNEEEILELVGGEGEYYIAYFFSYNGGTTPVNIVDRLDVLLQSAYDILPFLFPYLAQTSKVEDPIYEYSLSKNVLKNILSRLSKFSYNQNPDIIKSLENGILRENKLIEVSEENDSYTIKIANPSLISLLIKELYYSTEYKRDVYEKIINSLLQKGLEGLMKELNPGGEYLIPSYYIKNLISKVKNYSIIRKKYVNIFKIFNK